MKKVLRSIGAALAGLAWLPAEALAQWRGYDWGPGPGTAVSGYGMGWFWAVLMFAFWFAVMVALFLLIRLLSLQIGMKARASKSEETALDILKKRYAAGELGKEEFEEKRKDLGA